VSVNSVNKFTGNGKKKGLMSKTIAVHVRYNFLYISLPSSAKQQGVLANHDGDGDGSDTKQKVLMSRTMAVHVRFESWYISLPSSAKQQREMTKYSVLWRTRIAMANFWYLLLELNAVGACKARASFLTDRHTEHIYRIAKFESKYRFVFYKVCPPSPSSSLKLPVNNVK